MTAGSKERQPAGDESSVSKRVPPRTDSQPFGHRNERPRRESSLTKTSWTRPAICLGGTRLLAR